MPPSPGTGGLPPFDPARAYGLGPDVSLRAEPGGGLAYNHANRRLTFLRAPALVALVRELDRHESVEAALAAAPIAPRRRPAFRRALAALAASEVIRAR